MGHDIARLRGDEPMAPRRLATERRPAARAAPDRPTRLRLWMRRRRALLRPVGLGLAALGAVAALGYGLSAAAPRIGGGGAGSLVPSGGLGLADGLAGIGGTLGMRVREVVVEGRRNTPPELVHAALGVGRGDPTLGFAPQEAKERLESIAWVGRAHVERRLPGTILVRIEERRPFAIWQHQGRFAVIDRAGKVVATEGLDGFGPLPLVVGAGAERQAAALHDLLRAQPDLLARTQALVRIGERRWNLRLHNGTDVLLPEGAEAAAVERLGELHRRHGLLDRPLVAIDLRMPDRLVVRQHPQPEPPPAQAQQRNRSGRG